MKNMILFFTSRLGIQHRLVVGVPYEHVEFAFEVIVAVIHVGMSSFMCSVMLPCCG